MHYVSIKLGRNELQSCIVDLPYFNEIPDIENKAIENSPINKEQHNITEDDKVNQEINEANLDSYSLCYTIGKAYLISFHVVDLLPFDWSLL